MKSVSNMYSKEIALCCSSDRWLPFSLLSTIRHEYSQQFVRGWKKGKLADVSSFIFHGIEKQT